MILHSDLYVAKLSKMGRLTWEERFLFNQPGNRVYRNFKKLILRACKGVTYIMSIDQIENARNLQRRDDFMKLEVEVGYSSRF